MEVNPLVFETSASTDSAIWAYVFLNAVQRYCFFIYLQYFCKKTGKKKKRKEKNGKRRIAEKKYNVH